MNMSFEFMKLGEYTDISLNASIMKREEVLDFKSDCQTTDLRMFALLDAHAISTRIICQYLCIFNKFYPRAEYEDDAHILDRIKMRCHYNIRLDRNILRVTSEEDLIEQVRVRLEEIIQDRSLIVIVHCLCWQESVDRALTRIEGEMYSKSMKCLRRNMHAIGALGAQPIDVVFS